MGVIAAAAAMLIEVPAKAGALSAQLDVTDGPMPSQLPEGFTDAAGMQAEYAEALDAWPFEHPDGPVAARSVSIIDDEDGYWEVGSGTARMHSEWAGATAAAAYFSFGEGDMGTSQKHLAALVSAYQSPIVRAVTDDPENIYLRMVVEPAQLRNDFGPLVDFYDLA